MDKDKETPPLPKEEDERDEAVEASVRGYSRCDCGSTEFRGWECLGCGAC